MGNAPAIKCVKNKTPEAKNAVHAKCIEYLANPDNTKLKRIELAAAMGYSGVDGLYKLFGASELNAIYEEALILRRKTYAGRLALVDQGLLRRAAAGDAAAAKLAYQRFEAWVEKTKSEITVGVKTLVEALDDAENTMKVIPKDETKKLTE